MELPTPSARRRTARLPPAIAVLGLGAAAWGVAPAPATSALPPAALVAAGALLALRRPASAVVLLFAGAAAGPIAAGAAWMGPAVAATVAGVLALWATENPFAREIADERRRGRAPSRS